MLSAQQIQVGKKSRLYGSLAISVKIKLSDTFQSKSKPSLAIRFLLLGYKVQNSYLRERDFFIYQVMHRENTDALQTHTSVLRNISCFQISQVLAAGMRKVHHIVHTCRKVGLAALHANVWLL